MNEGERLNIIHAEGVKGGAGGKTEKILVGQAYVGDPRQPSVIALSWAARTFLSLCFR